MTTETKPVEKECGKRKEYHRGGAEAVYCLGMIGAWVYFIGSATTFWLGVLGFLKGIVWPAFLVFELMKFLGM